MLINKVRFIQIHNNFILTLLLFKFLEIQLVLFQTSCNASMGSMTVNGVNAEIVNISDSITISRTTIKSLASQERSITINDVSGTLMVMNFSNIVSSTTLNSNHNGIIMTSGNITLTLPEPSNNSGIRYTIKKIDTSSTLVTISGIVDGESNLQLSKQNSYITIISNGNAWYKVSEKITVSETVVDQTYISNSIGMTFRLIPSGTFVMGSPSDELGHSSDETQHTVTISEPYYIQTTEVTQGQWKAVMGNNPSSLTDCGLSCPVEYVSWEDVQSFIETLNTIDEGFYTLPTEAQWEFAARAGSDKAFANGLISDKTTDSNLDIMGWYGSNSSGKLHVVAQKQANAWGLFDMHGNLREWCHDWYGSYPTGSVTDPVGPLSGSNRVVRGCSFGNHAQYCRSARRFKFSPNDRYYYIGFRLSRTITD